MPVKQNEPDYEFVSQKFLSTYRLAIANVALGVGAAIGGGLFNNRNIFANVPIANPILGGINAARNGG